QVGKSSADDSSERCDAELLRLVTEVLLPFTVRHDVISCREDMIQIVNWCSQQRERRALADAGLQCLFCMCEGEETDLAALEIGSSAVSVVVKRCTEILDQYLTDERAQTNRLPKYRHDELVNVLQRLESTKF
ncbi:hypothetical protein DIPPA_24796, partial [Diplonema papillatum]